MNQEESIQEGICPFCGERFTEHSDLFDHLLEHAETIDVPDSLLLFCMRMAAAEEVTDA